MTRITCPLCATASITEVGIIPHSPPIAVAGVPIDLGTHTYRLLRCNRCGLRFKNPSPPVDQMLACYSAAEPDHWGDEDLDPHHRRFDDLHAMIRRRGGRGRILDVGCFNGAMLAGLTEWERFGVDPCRSAAARAALRGVTVLGETIDDVPPTRRFNVITAVDLVEHLTEPMAFFRKARDLLDPGGALVLVTGDADALTWKIQGSLYWYCNIPEHVTFFNRRALEWIAQRLNMKVAEYHRKSHQRDPLGATIRQSTMNAAYTAARAVHGLGIRTVRKRIDRGGPGWMSAPDHLFAALTINGDTSHGS